MSAATLTRLRQDDPTATPYNPAWDTRRLWVKELVEEDRQCSIRGAGRTNEDIAEFLRRLTSSNRFENVELVRTEGVTDQASGLVLINFELTAGVIY